MPVATSFVSPPLGHSIPYLTPHAVSVSLPTWQDNVGYEEGDKRVVDSMQTGYPRFFVHRSIQKLAGIANNTLANDSNTDKCYLYPTLKTANSCIAFLESRKAASSPSLKKASFYYKRFTISNPQDNTDSVTIYAVFMHTDDFGLGKQYWQHTGDGISSRLADHCLHLLGETIPGEENNKVNGSGNGQNDSSSSSKPAPLHTPSMRGFSRNKHYSKKSSAALEAIIASTPIHSSPVASSSNGTSPTIGSSYHTNGYFGNGNDNAYTNGNGNEVRENGIVANGEETDTYIEERYARNLSESQAPLAKIALRRRIAGVLNESTGNAIPLSPRSSFADQQLEVNVSQELEKASAADAALQPSSRGVAGLAEDGVYLYPGGMSAIFHSFMAILKNEEEGKGKSPAKDFGKSVCFGFPYTDTLKILEKWGPGCEFFGKGLDSDLEDLEILLKERRERYLANPDSTDPNDKPILSLFAEFPSNPLLRSPNLARLRSLADEYGFYIVVDETIGGFVNVECLPCADIVVSSLTKIFSGDSNVMGGSLTLNPASPHYRNLKATFTKHYEDTYYAQDVIFMERNSRDFKARVDKTNQNTEALCDFLREHTIASGRALTKGKKPVLTAVYYPKYITPENYAARMRQPCAASNGITGDCDVKAGFGSLFSVTFSSMDASKAFFDALKCCKGPSLGTNFTLACPYTILAHYLELDWAAKWGVEAGLVRVAVGLEELSTLLEWFTLALEEAEKTS